VRLRTPTCQHLLRLQRHCRSIKPPGSIELESFTVIDGHARDTKQPKEKKAGQQVEKQKWVPDVQVNNPSMVQVPPADVLELDE